MKSFIGLVLILVFLGLAVARIWDKRLEKIWGNTTDMVGVGLLFVAMGVAFWIYSRRGGDGGGGGSSGGGSSDSGGGSSGGGGDFSGGGDFGGDGGGGD